MRTSSVHPRSIPYDRLEATEAHDPRARLAALVESSHDAIIGETSDGVITSWNAAAARLYGWSASEMIGKHISATVPAEREEELSGILERVRRGEPVDHLETQRLRKDGSRVDVSLTISPIRDGAGRVVGISKISRDIGPRKRFEEKLWRQNLALQNANRAKDAFLASMSHELRTPLNAIIGFTGTLLLKLPGPLTSDQERQLGLIQTSARHLLSLINDMLNLARIQSGKVELRHERLACAALVREVASTLRPTALAKGLYLKVRLPSREIRLTTDRRALLQILINLTSNAVKFTHEGGIVIEVKRRRRKGGGDVLFRVIDTGPGIGQEDRARLFHAFEQIQPVTSDIDAGTGLGLHLSRKMAELLGGEIGVESELTRGSVFTLRLPAA